MTTCPWPSLQRAIDQGEIAVVDARLSHGGARDAHQEGRLRMADQDLVEIEPRDPAFAAGEPKLIATRPRGVEAETVPRSRSMGLDALAVQNHDQRRRTQRGTWTAFGL